MASIQLTSPLILAADPTLPLHPATKQYVDNKADNIVGSGFSAGLLNVMRLPALVGEVTMAEGSGTLVLTTTGVVPGTYTRVVLGGSGRITTGGALAADDMPQISWNKITSGLPTTLAGYGLANVIGLAGGTVTGVLTSNAVPSASLHLVTKSYVDAMIQPSGDSLATGDIVRKGVIGSPSGFLRANGSKVSKTTYANLYAILGDRYKISFSDGVEAPWVHQQKLNLGGISTGTLFGVNVKLQGNDNATPLCTFVTHNKIYIIGSHNSGGYRYARALVATINPDGTFSNFSHDASITFGGQGSMFEYDIVHSFVHKNKIWIYSGWLGTIRLWRGNINADGTITNPTLYSTPTGLKRSSKAVIIKNRLYFVDYNYSGSTGALELVYANFDSNGDISAFTSLGQIHATAMKDDVIDAFVYKDKFIIIARTAEYIYSAFYASINSDGTLGAWTPGPTLSFPSYIGRPIANCRAVTTTNGIIIPFSWDHSWFTEGTGEEAFSYQAYALKIAKLNTDAAGVPISWEMSEVLGNTGGQAVGRKTVAVAGRLYITMQPHTSSGVNAHYLDFSGGLNTYKQYYDGSLSTDDPLNFYLPDFTSKETHATKYYVKT